LVFDGEDGSENILAGPGTFSLEIRADEASYTITVEDCAGAPADPGDEPGGAPGDANNPDDVIDDTIPKKPVLANTGGFPLLLGAGLLLVCAAAVSVRILRP